jgi:hypothetical protein
MGKSKRRLIKLERARRSVRCTSLFCCVKPALFMGVDRLCFKVDRFFNGWGIGWAVFCRERVFLRRMGDDGAFIH